MSSDLLKEFGAFEKNLWSNSTDQGDSRHARTDVDEDDFGDFEEAENSNDKSDSHTLDTQLPASSTSDQSYAKIPRPESRNIAQRLTLQEEQNSPSDGDDWGEFAKSSVLFDADQATIDDGDSPSAPSKLSLFQPGMASLSNAPMLPIDSDIATSTAAKSVPDELCDNIKFDEDQLWEPVENTLDPITPSRAPTSTTPTEKSDIKPKTSPEVNPRTREPPPSNIPPPSVLLQSVTTHFQSMSLNAKDITDARSVSSDSSKVPKQAKTDQIPVTLAMARAGARIIAGRKVRWKRDNLLSQSLKIGQVSAKSSGMKLAGLDKTESRREDQEAAEALSAWRRKVGPLRSAVSAMTAQSAGSGLALPEISEDMPIRTVKPSEGAVTSLKGCFLCGIKRDERVSKVDVDVEDSFGEWWVEHWGHVDCVLFWESCESLLPQR